MSGNFDHMVGVDPGFTSVVTARFASGENRAYSSARYYEDSGFNTSRRRTDAWNAQTEALIEAIPSPKVATLDGAKAHVAGLLENLGPLLEHRFAKGYRNMRFMRFVGKHKAVDAICDLLAPRGKRTVVGFGDWSAGSSSCISRKTCGPVQEVKRALGKNIRVSYFLQNSNPNPTDDVTFFG